MFLISFSFFLFFFFFYFSVADEIMSIMRTTSRELVNKNRKNTGKQNRSDKKRVSTIFAENLPHYSLRALERKQHFQSSLYFDLDAAISGKQFKC